MVPEKLKRSLRRFHRCHASSRRQQVRRLRGQIRHPDREMDDQGERLPTRQELQVTAEFRQAIQEVELP
jgi:hypothetical protein